jgi:hypothetical protein
MKKLLSVPHCLQRSNKNNRSLKKEVAMSDLKHPLIEQAYHYAEDCYADANATVDSLHQAIEALQAEDSQLREALSQSFIKADEFIDHCGAIVQELQQLRLKYCAAHSTSGLSPDLDLLTETFAGIEKRRQARRQSQP